MATPVPTRRILATRTAHSGRREESRRTGCRFASRSRALGFRPSQTLCVKREVEFVLPRGLGRETGRRFDRRLLPGPDASLGGGRRRALHRRDPHSLQANSRTQPSAIPVGDPCRDDPRRDDPGRDNRSVRWRKRAQSLAVRTLLGGLLLAAFGILGTAAQGQTPAICRGHTAGHGPAEGRARESGRARDFGHAHLPPAGPGGPRGNPDER